ncbi:unnamed protein product [Sphagnum tenellum]
MVEVEGYSKRVTVANGELAQRMPVTMTGVHRTSLCALPLTNVPTLLANLLLALREGDPYVKVAPSLLLYLHSSIFSPTIVNIHSKEIRQGFLNSSSHNTEVTNHIFSLGSYIRNKIHNSKESQVVVFMGPTRSGKSFLLQKLVGFFKAAEAPTLSGHVTTLTNTSSRRSVGRSTSNSKVTNSNGRTAISDTIGLCLKLSVACYLIVVSVQGSICLFH